MLRLQCALLCARRIAASAPAQLRRAFASSPDAADAWHASRVAPDGTHHVSGAAGTALYAQRFACVLPFHALGLAPAQLLRDAGGGRGGGTWCHIRASGEPLDAQRYQRTFGFYEDRAAVTVRCYSVPCVVIATPPDAVASFLSPMCRAAGVARCVAAYQARRPACICAHLGVVRQLPGRACGGVRRAAGRRRLWTAC